VLLLESAEFTLFYANYPALIREISQFSLKSAKVAGKVHLMPKFCELFSLVRILGNPENPIELEKS